MEWIQLRSEEQLTDLQKQSQEIPVLIFKHSTRCSTSRMTLDRLERSWTRDLPVKAYFLDLLTYRGISNRIAALYGVEHESPQVILVRNGKAVLDLSHFNIDYAEIKNAVSDTVRN